jgi:hypothetical protein
MIAGILEIRAMRPTVPIPSWPSVMTGCRLRFYGSSAV